MATTSVEEMVEKAKKKQKKTTTITATVQSVVGNDDDDDVEEVTKITTSGVKVKAGDRARVVVFGHIVNKKGGIMKINQP
jgi:hypothetical protein